MGWAGITPVAGPGSEPGPGRLCAVMVWIVTGVVLGVCALAALGYLGLRVWRELRVLLKEVGRATAVLTEAAGPAKEQLARTQSALARGNESLSAVR